MSSSRLEDGQWLKLNYDFHFGSSEKPCPIQRKIMGVITLTPLIDAMFYKIGKIIQKKKTKEASLQMLEFGIMNNEADLRGTSEDVGEDSDEFIKEIKELCGERRKKYIELLQQITTTAKSLKVSKDEPSNETMIDIAGSPVKVGIDIDFSSFPEEDEETYDIAPRERLPSICYYIETKREELGTKRLNFSSFTLDGASFAVNQEFPVIDSRYLELAKFIYDRVNLQEEGEN